MGVCQQFDVLYDELSVYQHIAFAFAMKVLNPSTQGIEDCMNAVGLHTDHDSFKTPPEMSGGMKRKLSLSLSLVGDPKILFLDEPTSAMDTEIRSQVRCIIKSLKVNRTIILTTQHMDEAEELSDQVALLSRGQLSALGTVDSIKKQFGVGYSLKITSSNHNNNIHVNLTTKQVESILIKYVEDYHFKAEDSNAEMLK